MPIRFPKTDAPFLVSFGLYNEDPQDADIMIPSSREEMIEHVSNTSDFYQGFDNGEIVCALVPVDFKYLGDDGQIHSGEVSRESLVEMLSLQRDIARGVKPKYVEPKHEKKPECEQAAVHDEPEGDELCADGFDEEPTPAHIPLEDVEQMLCDKGYTTPGMKNWDAESVTYWVLDPENAMDGSVSGPCGSYYPMKPVNNPIWGQEDEYEPMFLAAQVEAIPEV